MKQGAWNSYAVLAFVALLPAANALAQDYPALPIRMVVGFSPGGAGDLSARLAAQNLAAQLNSRVVVENREGANSNIAAELVSKARPDGYTLLFNTSSNVLSTALGEKLGYDVLRDLAPVVLVGTAPVLLMVNLTVPANTVAEFVSYVKANPGKLAYGSGGTGSIMHLASVLFLQANGVTALHVPYKGAAPAILDLVGGRTQFVVGSMESAIPMLKEKRLRALGIGSGKRVAQLPDVPTFSETMPGFEVGSFYGVMAPARTPAAIIRTLNAALMKALQEPDMRAKLAQYNIEPRGSTPEEYGAFLKNELERWTKVIKSAGVTSE